MKISDEELLNAIWINQLRLLPRGVLHNYIGGGFGLVDNNDSWYDSASSEHTCSKRNITKVIGNQQLRKRLIKLHDAGEIKFPHHSELLTFFIDSIEAKKAFVFARVFWKKNGVPEGIDNGRCRTVKLDNIDELAAECERMLRLEFLTETVK